MDEPTRTPPEPVILREQDEKLIRACCRYQWMTSLDMAMLLNLPTSLNYVRRIAASLAGNNDGVPGQYLYRLSLPRRSGGGNALRVFVPGEATRRLLHEEDSDGFVFTPPATMRRYSYSFVCHNLAVTRLAICAATLFCRDNPSYYLVETRLSYDIARTPPRVSFTLDGKPTTSTVIPDCWLYIERVADGQGTALWLEVDNSTTYRTSFHRRLSARLAIITSEAYEEYFGTDAVLLCYAVLGNEDRIHTLRHWTWELLEKQERVQLAPFFRFASIEYETLYREALTLYTKPVWRLPADRDNDDPALVALLPPPQDKEEAHGNSQTTDLS
jgi:hypothetical protein